MGQACRRTFVVVVGDVSSPEEERRRRRRRRLRGRGGGGGGGGGGRARLRGGQQCEGILVNKRFPGLSRAGGGGTSPSLPPSSSSSFVSWGFVCPPGSGGRPAKLSIPQGS